MSCGYGIPMLRKVGRSSHSVGSLPKVAIHWLASSSSLNMNESMAGTDDQGESLSKCQCCGGRWMMYEQTVQPRDQASAFLSHSPVITASGARIGSGQRILVDGGRCPERKADPKPITFTLQLLNHFGCSIAEGEQRYRGRCLVRCSPWDT
jgi:hypothetical protein